MSNGARFSNSREMRMAQMLRSTHRWMATLAYEPRGPLSAVTMSLEELRSLRASEPGSDLGDIARDAAACSNGMEKGPECSLGFPIDE